MKDTFLPVRARACFPALALTVLLVPHVASAAGPITRYEIDVRIAPKQETIQADAKLTVVAPEGGLRQIRLLLNRALTVRSVKADAGVKSYSFDRTQPSGYRYTPTAAPLVVDLVEPLPAGRTTILDVSYDGRIEPDPWHTNEIRPDWAELAMYAAWYPYDPASSSFTSAVTVKTDPGYGVTGWGVVTRSQDAWIVTRDEPSWDIIVITAPNLQARRVGNESAGIEVCYAKLDAENADRVAADAGRILNTLQGWLGPVSSKSLRIVFAERKSGGGYYRNGFMTLIWDPDYPGLVRYAAHEAAHFWWGRGQATTWEDWLNESFAEFTALMIMRDWYGEQVFEDTIARYRKEAENAPPIRGLDRNDAAAQAVLYRKGPVLLYDLEKQIGKQRFRELLARLVERKVATTDQMLATLEELTSKDIRAAFEQRLAQ